MYVGRLPRYHQCYWDEFQINIFVIRSKGMRSYTISHLICHLRHYNYQEVITQIKKTGKIMPLDIKKYA